MIGPFRKKYRILSHLAFWLCIFGMFMLTGMFRGSDLKDVALLNLALLPMDMAAAYTVIYLIIPRFLFRKRYLLFFLFFFAFTIAYVSLVTIPLEYYLAINYYEADKWGSVMEFARSRLLWSLVILTMINGLAASVKITKHWLLVQNEKQQVEKEKFGTELKLREAELRFLRSQMHPHFLFNTLNNLYGLTLEKSDLASEVVVKLSEMLDYMLYECNENLVPLDKELKLLDNYIALERIRHEEEVDIRMEVKGPTAGLKIAPLIFLPFVENGFKHGLNGQTGDKWLHITLDITAGRLCFVVENSKEGNAAEAAHANGIGLKNLEKRLDLQYRNRYRLRVGDHGRRFSSRLELDLD